MMDPKTVGVNIARYRKEKEMTQAMLADKLGVSNKAVSKWECGRGLPDKTMFPVLEELLGVTREQLISGETTCVSENEEIVGENATHGGVGKKRKKLIAFLCVALIAVLLLGIILPIALTRGPQPSVFTLTLRGASFGDGSAEHGVEEGSALPSVSVDIEKTFLGWADQYNNYFAGDDFVMPSEDLVLSAIYAEDLGEVYTPSCVYEDLSKGTKYAAQHKYVDGYKATVFVAHELTYGNGFKILNGYNLGMDLGRPDICENYFPVSPKENNIIFLTFINNGEEELKLSYSIDYFGIVDTIDVDIPAGSEKTVPFAYDKCKESLPYVLTSYHRVTFRNSVKDMSLTLYGRMYDAEYYSLKDNSYTFSVTGGTIDGETSKEIYYRKNIEGTLLPDREEGFVGWKTGEGKVYSSTDQFVSFFRMPAKAVSVKAVYSDEMSLYTPSCIYKDKSKPDSEKKTGEHVGEATEYIMDASVSSWVIYNGPDEKHDVPDSCPSSINEERFYLMSFSCESDTDLTLTVGPEYYGLKCPVKFTIPANGSVTVLMKISGFDSVNSFWQIINENVSEGTFTLTVSGRYA